jgi:hypothetical protein
VWPLPFTLKCSLRQKKKKKKKNYGNSNISPCKNIIKNLQKINPLIKKPNSFKILLL